MATTKRLIAPKLCRETLMETFDGYTGKAKRWSASFHKRVPYLFLYVYRNIGLQAALEYSGVSLEAIQGRLHRVYVLKYNQLIRATRTRTALASDLFPRIVNVIRGEPGFEELYRMVVDSYLTSMYVWIALRLPFIENFVHWVLHELHHRPKHPHRTLLMHIVDVFYGVLPLDVVRTVLSCTCTTGPHSLEQTLCIAELDRLTKGRRFRPVSKATDLLNEIKIEL